MATTSAEFDQSLFHLSNPEHRYLSVDNKRNLEELISGIKQNTKLFLVTGEEGSGKTSLIQLAICGLGNKTRLVELSRGNLNYQELINNIGNDLETGFSVESSLEKKKLRLKELLQMWSLQHVVIVINEALNCQKEMFDDVFELLDSKIYDSCCFHLVIAGLPGIEKRLKQAGVTNTTIGSASSLLIEPLSSDEVITYIDFHLQKLKDKGKNLFSDAALKSIIHYSKGLPRLINRLCSLGLLTAKLEEKPTVTRLMIEEVLENSLLLGNECGYSSSPYKEPKSDKFDTPVSAALAKDSLPQKKLIEDIESDLQVDKEEILDPIEQESIPSTVQNDVNKNIVLSHSSNKTVFITAFIMGIIFSALIGAGLYFVNQANLNVSSNQVAITGSESLLTEKQLRQQKIAALMKRSEKQLEKQQLMVPEKDNAWETFQEILALEPDHPGAVAGITKIKDTYVIWAREEIKQENYQQAAYHYSKALAASPDDQDILKALQDIDNKKHKPAKTIEVPVAKLALTEQEEQRIHDLLLRAQQQLADKKLMTPDADSAWSSYKNILALDPDHQQALAGINKIKETYKLWAKHEIKRGNKKHAVFLLLKALQISPDAPELLSLLAKIQGTQPNKNRYDSALSEGDFYKLLDDPKGIGELINFAERQIARKRLTKPEKDSAYKIYQLILERFPSNEEALAGVAKIKETYARWARHETRQGNYSQAEFLYGKALEVAPADPEIMSALWQVMKNTSVRSQ